MRTLILLNGDMVVTIPKEEVAQQLQHLDSLEPQTQQEFDEITVLFGLVNKIVNQGTKCPPVVKKSLITVHHLKLVKG